MNSYTLHSSGRGVKQYGKRISPGPNNVTFLFITLSIFIIIGILFSILMIPTNSDNPLKNTNSHGLTTKVVSLRQKIMKWIPTQNIDVFRDPFDDIFFEPDWVTSKFWTPIDLEVSKDSMVTLCQLNFKAYFETPHKYAMFRDLVAVSNCLGTNRKREKISVLLADMKSKNTRHIEKPTGFIFHESRVGSTLVANNLASDPMTLVFSESAPPANALLHCTRCSREESIKLLKDIITLMSVSPIHDRIFFKFQSITTTRIDVVLEAFPETPWAFVYRNPVQTMMSHLDPRKNSNGAPCLRSMRDPPLAVKQQLQTINVRDPPKEAWCASHLNMLCENAIGAYEKFGTFSDNRQRGLFINYESLPGVISILLLPIFGIKPTKHWLLKMKSESTNYSKGKLTTTAFTGDSEDKESHATDAIKSFADLLLNPSFLQMENISVNVIKKFSIKDDGLLQSNQVNWNSISIIPDKLTDFSKNILKFTVGNMDFNVTQIDNRHSKFSISEFKPWAPFSNSHNSRPFEVPNCEEFPDKDYPKTFPILNLTNNWNTDSVEIPPYHYDSLCHFNYQNETELEYAFNYRKAEVPFVVFNFPGLDNVVKKWSNPEYLHKLLGEKDYRTETSKDNHFMYWRGAGSAFLRGKNGKKWKPPTGIVSTKFEDWLELAVKGQNLTLDEREHQYFRVSSDLGNPWLFDELPFYKPVKSIFLVEPKEQRGIHCRFGMRSVIAEAHFDGSRNSVAMIGGLRRWILTHPDQCPHMYMYKNEHPSGRHSEVDWSNPDVDKFPNFRKVQSNEVILQPGDVLYVPTFWIHYIVSLNVNYQCNTRSGKSDEFDESIKKCGF